MMINTTLKESNEKEAKGKQPKKKIGRETTTHDITKFDIRRDPRSLKIKALKALVRIKIQIINMTIDTGSPVSFLNWTTAKQFLDGSSEINFIPAGKLKLTMQFVDYNKHPIQILGAVCADIRSAGWEFKDAYFLGTEKSARCLLGLDLQGKLGIEVIEHLRSQPLSIDQGLTCYCASSQKV